MRNGSNRKHLPPQASQGPTQLLHPVPPGGPGAAKGEGSGLGTYIFRLMRRHAFLSCLMGPSLFFIGLALGGSWVWLGFVATAVFGPLFMDLLGNEPEHGIDGKESKFFTCLITPIQVSASLLALHYATIEIRPFVETLGVALSLGASVGTIGTAVAHELFHAPEKIKRTLGTLSLAQLSFAQYRFAHIFAHHRFASTPMDPESARRGESLYAYTLRLYFSAWAWGFKKDPREAAAAALYQVSIWAGVVYFFGLIGFFVWMVQTFIGLMIVMGVLYVTHYGLTRREIAPGQYERFQPHHAWDTDALAFNLYFYQIGHHSQHHAQAHLPHSGLSSPIGPMKYPRSYIGMVPLTFIPWLWFKTVDPIIEQTSKV